MTALRLVRPPRVSSPATTALKAFIWLVRDARLHPSLADVRLRAAFWTLQHRLELETAS